jgi:SAM-dependent methyltransferase
MDKLIKQYQTHDNTELEVRFYLEAVEWQNLYKHLLTLSIPVKIEQSIHTLEDKSGKTNEEDKFVNRKELYFTNGSKTDEKYIRKTRLVILKTPMGKVSLASEEPISNFSTHNSTLIRLRLRASMEFPEDPDWRIDFTIIKSLSKAQFALLKKTKEEMFPTGVQVKPETLLGVNFSDPTFSYELEVEHVGDADKLTPASIDKMLTIIQNMINPGKAESSTYHAKIYDIARLLLSTGDSSAFKNKYSLKQLANNPKNFSLEEYVEDILPNIDNYYLSDKADGERCFLMFEPDKKTATLITSDKLLDITKQVTKPITWKKFTDIVLVDTEVIDLKSNSTEVTFEQIYLFDVLINGFEKKVHNLDFEKRQALLDDISAATKTEKKIQMRLTTDRYDKQIRDMYSRKSRLYPIDGLVFTPAHILGENRSKYSNHHNYFDMTVYKWKPPDKMTIDFLVMKPLKNLLGVKPYIVKPKHELYFLFVGINYNNYRSLGLEYVSGYKELFDGYKFDQNYFPIQFAPSSNPLAYLYYHPTTGSNIDLHGHIAEFRYNCLGEEMGGADCKWIFDRLRPDKDINVQKGTGYGNDFKVAESTLQGYYQPVTIDVLANAKPTTHEKTESQGDDDKYFAEAKATFHKAPTKFNAYVKAQVLRQTESSQFVIDLAAGQGADMYVLNGFNVKNGLFVDKDKSAIGTLDQRRYKLTESSYYIYSNKPSNVMNITTKVIDLTEPADKIIEALTAINPMANKGADAVVINFAIHYLIHDMASLQNVITLIDGLLKPGGVFIFTCFSGELITKLLKGIPVWERYEKDVLKYKIEKRYKSDELTDFGQKIGVLLPMSQGKLYEENLVNIDTLVKEFAKQNYHIRQNSSFGDWLDGFRVFNKQQYDTLTDDDKLYCSLYHYVSLWKSTETKQKKGGKLDRKKKTPITPETDSLKPTPPIGPITMSHTVGTSDPHHLEYIIDDLFHDEEILDA